MTDGKKLDVTLSLGAAAIIAEHICDDDLNALRDADADRWKQIQTSIQGRLEQAGRAVKTAQDRVIDMHEIIIAINEAISKQRQEFQLSVTASMSADDPDDPDGDADLDIF